MRNNTCFHRDSAHLRVTKGRTVNEPQFILYRVVERHMKNDLWTAS